MGHVRREGGKCDLMSLSSLEMDVAPEVWSDLGASAAWYSGRPTIGVALLVAAAVLGFTLSVLYYCQL